MPRQPNPINGNYRPKKQRETVAEAQRKRMQVAEIVSDPDIPAESKLEAVNPVSNFQRSRGSERPPEVSERVWDLAGEFIAYGITNKKDLGLEEDELRIRRDRLSQGIDKFLNSKTPSEFLSLIQRKFADPQEYVKALDWLLNTSIRVYWDNWSEHENGFHQVRFVEYLDGLLRRSWDLYQHHLWDLHGRPEMPRIIRGGSMQDLLEQERQEGERRLISHFGGRYPGYRMKVEDDLLLALPEPTDEGDETQ